MEYRICTRCVMDTSDPHIIFDNKGYCNHCSEAEQLLKTRWFPNEVGEEKFNEVLKVIKDSSQGKRYDCIIGLSGGIDSSYLLYLAAKKWGLKVLAVHVNAGWNSEIAESNIENLINQLNVDLYTYVVDWEEVRDLQLAYFRSGLKNLDVPQDHIFFSQLYKKAAREKIQYVFTGHNLVTESITPASWGYNAMDSRQLKFIHKKFGTIPLRSYETISLYKWIYYTVFRKQRVIKPLDYFKYDKDSAKKILENNFSWKGYDVKHGESVFTRFYQNYWLPKRYGYDKRRSHFSSMIMSGYLTREIALEELKKPLYDGHTLTLDIEYICNKLEIKQEELEGYLNMPKIDHTFYPNNEKIFQLAVKVKNHSKIKVIK